MLLFAKNRMVTREMRKHGALFIAVVSEEVVKQSYEAPSWKRHFLILRELLRNFYDITALNRKFISLEGKRLLSIDQRQLILSEDGFRHPVPILSCRGTPPLLNNYYICNWTNCPT